MTTELNEVQVEALKVEIEAFLLERDFVRVDSRDITGVNSRYEFHIYTGKKALDVTIIDRLSPELIDEAQFRYNDQTIVELHNLIGR